MAPCLQWSGRIASHWEQMTRYSIRRRVHTPSRRRSGGVTACCACQQPAEERCKNSVAVILFERG
jgi:hypothetical protein